MNQSYADHDQVNYFSSIGNILRILYDFDSYNVVRDEWTVTDDEETRLLLIVDWIKSLKIGTELKGVPPKSERQMKTEMDRLKAKRNYDLKQPPPPPELIEEEIGIDCNTGKPFNNTIESMLRYKLKKSNGFNLTTGCAANGTAFNWTIYHYIQAPFAFLIGSLNALG